jgi:hypothetical protein
VFPQAQELWAVFLSGGLFGVLLYRLWTMLLTSLLGILMAGHAGLLLLESNFQFDAVTWVVANQAAANGVVVGLTTIGVLLQSIVSPDEKKAEGEKGKSKEKKEEKKPPKKPEPPAEEKAQKPEKKAAWWQKLFQLGKTA